ncbi:hypothetical protein ABEF95_008578 [Exophiala dermatitidis]
MSLTAANQRDLSVQDQALRSSGTETGDVDSAQRHGLQLPYVMQQDSLRTVSGSSNSHGRRRSSRGDQQQQQQQHHQHQQTGPHPQLQPGEHDRSLSFNPSSHSTTAHSFGPSSGPEQALVRPSSPLTPNTTTTDHAGVLRSRRSRSQSRNRLQKRPSSRALRNSASTPAMAHASSTLHAQSLDSSSQGLTALPQLPEQVIPQRSSSLRKKSRPLTADQPLSIREQPEAANDRRIASAPNGILSLRPKHTASEAPVKSEFQGESLPSSPARSSSPTYQTSPAAGQRTPRHLPLAPNDPSPLNPLYYTPSSSSTPRKQSTMSSSDPGNSPPTGSSNRASTSQRQSTSSQPQPTGQPIEHSYLPPGFKPGYTEQTHVVETIRPAVTQEVVKNKRTEIVQEEITRHIHVHHYYTYIQPIRVVEVLPARHYTIDEKTGQKVEIPAPDGWEMPASLQPTKPDLSGIAPESRHYLVDEEHPNGIPEPPPEDIKPRSPQELKSIARASNTAKWSPFPKVR